MNAKIPHATAQEYITWLESEVKRLEALEKENAALILGQDMLVHLHGELSKEVIGYPVLKSTAPPKEQP